MKKVDQLTSAEAVDRLLKLIKFEQPILDLTYGSGMFWVGSDYKVEGCDINPNRAKDHCCNFLALPFADNSYNIVVYDPPFHPNVGTIQAGRFSTLGKNAKELKLLFITGLRESWRVSSQWLLVKCQDYIHNNEPQWMPLWCVAELGEPYEWLISTRASKIISGRWKSVKSLRRNHADYLLFSKKGNRR